MKPLDESQTQMVKASTQTKMVKGDELTRMVKVKVEKDTLVGTTLHHPGEVVEVTEERAKELCTPMQGRGFYPFDGERGSTAETEKVVRATRI